jgi:TP901 family phage tail tape measure protein
MILAYNKKIQIDIEADDNASGKFKNVANNVTSMADKINGSILKFGYGLRAYNNSMSDFNRTALRVFEDAGRAVYKFTSTAIKDFSDLEQQHAKTLGAMANNYDKTAASQAKFLADSEKLKKAAISLGTVGPNGNGALYSPKEVSYAQTALIKSGKTATEVADSSAVSSILKFAGGNDLSIDQATDFAVNMGTQFNIKMKDWGTMLDKVTRAADLSVIDVPDIMESVKYAGGIASGLGRSIDETLGAIAVMGNAGLKGTMSGTGLQAIFTRILNPTGITSVSKPPSKKVEDIYNGFTAKTIDKNGKLKQLSDITPLLDEAMNDLTDQEQAWFAKKLFGLYQMKAAYALKRPGVNGENVLKEMTNQITDTSQGTNENKWAIMLKTQPGKIKALQNAATGIMTDIGDRLSPAVEAVSDELYNFLSSNGNYDIDFTKLKDAINKSGDKIGEQYGKQLGNAISSIGNTSIDAARIVKAIMPTGTGIAGFLGKLLGGDINGAFDTLSRSLKDTNENISDLPDDLKGVANGANNVIIAFATLSAINLGAKVLEVFTNLYNNTIGKAFKAINSAIIKSTKTDVASTTASITGSVIKANTPLMNVTATVVNVYGPGGAGTGTGGTPTTPMLPGGKNATGTGSADKPLLGPGEPPGTYKDSASGRAGAMKLAGVLAAAAVLATIPSSESQTTKGIFDGMGGANGLALYKDPNTGDTLGGIQSGIGDYAKYGEGGGTAYIKAKADVQNMIMNSVPAAYKSAQDSYFSKITGLDAYNKSLLQGQSSKYYYDKTSSGVPVSKEEFITLTDNLANKLAESIKTLKTPASNSTPGLFIPKTQEEAMAYMKASQSKQFGPQQPSLTIDALKEYAKSQSVTTEVTTNTTLKPTFTLNPNVNVNVTVDNNGLVLKKSTTSSLPDFIDWSNWYNQQQARYGSGKSK